MLSGLLCATITIMHHYRSREDEMSCGGGAADPYFYLRLSAGASPYNNPIKLEVDVKPEPVMSPVALRQHQLHGSPPDPSSMDPSARKDDEAGATGIGLLALTQLDGYGGGYKYDAVPPPDHGVVVIQPAATAADLVDDPDDDFKSCRYSSYGRLMYPTDDDGSKLQV